MALAVRSFLLSTMYRVSRMYRVSLPAPCQGGGIWRYLLYIVMEKTIPSTGWYSQCRIMVTLERVLGLGLEMQYYTVSCVCVCVCTAWRG